LRIDRVESNFWFCEVGLHAISNAYKTSRKAAVQYLPASISIFIFLIILCIYSMVAYLCRNPIWWLGIIFCLSIISKSLDNRSFSNNFDKTGSKLIGLYDSASSAGLFSPHLWWFHMGEAQRPRRDAQRISQPSLHCLWPIFHPAFWWAGIVPTDV